MKYFCLLVLREGSKLLGFCVSSDEDVSQRLDKNHLLVYSDFLHCVVLTIFRTGLDSFWTVWYREETKTKKSVFDLWCLLVTQRIAHFPPFFQTLFQVITTFSLAEEEGGKEAKGEEWFC